MDVPEGHKLEADPLEFLRGAKPLIEAKVAKDIKALRGVKFQLALRVELGKEHPDGSMEFTDPVIRSKQEAVLQPQ